MVKSIIKIGMYIIKNKEYIIKIIGYIITYGSIITNKEYYNTINTIY